MINLLVTGFGAFPGAATNPSAALAGALQTRRFARMGVQLHIRILPVIFAKAEHRLTALIEEIRPDGILHLGLAGRRHDLCLETRAINRHGLFQADTTGKLPQTREIEKGAPHIRRVRMPIAQATACLNARGARARRSIDASAYACNQTLFITLASPVRLAGFIHVPHPQGRRPQARVKRKRIPLAAMVAGVETVLLEMVRALRAQ